jgi:NADPH-ferrihemoprotein reductase
MGAKSDPTVLKSMRYAVFGLGNATYRYFNEMGKVIDRCFTEMGATRIVETGLGDAEMLMDEEFAEWREGLWSTLIPDIKEHRTAVGEKPES